MVGESFNAVIPAGGMGGEPVKTVMLKTHYGVDYREGTASLILAKTINMIALVIFLIGGFALMTQAQALNDEKQEHPDGERQQADAGHILISPRQRPGLGHQGEAADQEDHQRLSITPSSQLTSARTRAPANRPLSSV